METIMSYKKNKNYSQYRNQTKLVRGGLFRSNHGETSEAIFMNSGYVFNSAEEAKARFAGELEGYLYSRYGNPTVTMFEERMALNEGVESCFATASGMSAVFSSLMCQLKAGDHVVAAEALFGSCYHILSKILPQYGIETTLIDGTDNSQWEQNISENTDSMCHQNFSVSASSGRPAASYCCALSTRFFTSRAISCSIVASSSPSSRRPFATSSFKITALRFRSTSARKRSPPKRAVFISLSSCAFSATS